MSDHLGGIGHLGQHFGRDKRGDFDFAQARRDKRIDPAKFVGGWHDAFDGLQTVSRSDFANEYFW